jgi:hypothetical protein
MLELNLFTSFLRHVLRHVYGFLVTIWSINPTLRTVYPKSIPQKRKFWPYYFRSACLCHHQLTENQHLFSKSLKKQ